MGNVFIGCCFCFIDCHQVLVGQSFLDKHSDNRAPASHNSMVLEAYHTKNKRKRVDRNGISSTLKSLPEVSELGAICPVADRLFPDRELATLRAFSYPRAGAALLLVSKTISAK